MKVSSSWRYTSPLCQVILVSFVCFATVGMFSAVSNLGAGGTQSITLSNITNAVLYALFALTGLVSGSFNNVFGPRITLFVGSLGYALYLAALWVYQEKAQDWFLVLSGAVLGMCAALLWTAQGCIMLSYPLEAEKGRSFSIFWAIFNSGSLMGGLIALGINLKQGGLDAVKTTTYIAFFAIIMVGVALTWTLLPPNRVVRTDGTLVKVEKSNTARQEIRALFSTLKRREILLLIPMMFASNFFYPYQGSIAFKVFDSSARSVNGVVKSAGQIIGALLLGVLLDKLPMSRRNRGIFGLSLTAIFTIIAYSWGIKYQLPITRATQWPKKINHHDSDFSEPISIFVLYDIGDAFYQGLAYWIMGAITNDPFELARYAGMYKAVQSAGAAVAFAMDATLVPYINEIGAVFGLMLFSFPFALIVILGIRESNYEVEKQVYVDETAAENTNAIHVLENGASAAPAFDRQSSGSSEKKV
ncbi:related to UNC93-like protein 2 [Moesziomyces antarcticus]|uniref:Related to UNC93-like protein 2 n=1 Tax=Pseudozyma antarctica TaxID=84753 RepID=A0A5C3FN68_PSEA2|nr:related to UNC93-like protein 2 [Moesziomyces antarcticus]